MDLDATHISKTNILHVKSSLWDVENLHYNATSYSFQTVPPKDSFLHERRYFLQFIFLRASPTRIFVIRKARVPATRSAIYLSYSLAARGTGLGEKKRERSKPFFASSPRDMWLILSIDFGNEIWPKMRGRGFEPEVRRSRAREAL